MQVPQDQALLPLARAIAEGIAAAYRISPEDALPLVLRTIAGDARFRRAVGEAAGEAALKRTAAYKQLVGAARKAVYYHLRQYRAAGTRFEAALEALRKLGDGAAPSPPALCDARALEVARAHVSTAERFADRDAFAALLAEACPEARTIVDVGSGVLPLLLGASLPALRLDRYLALDRDAQAVAAIELYARLRGWPWLGARRWSLEEGWDALGGVVPAGGADLGLLLKVVPVIARQAPALLPILAATPARTLIVTGASESMTKRQSIERRERRLVEGFLERHGFAIRRSFDLAGEVGYVAARESMPA